MRLQNIGHNSSVASFVGVCCGWWHSLYVVHQVLYFFISYLFESLFLPNCTRSGRYFPSCSNDKAVHCT